jgi:hypothetical protein
MSTRNIRSTQQRLKALRAQIQTGIDAIDRGDFIEVAEGDLERALTQLLAKSGGRALRRRPRR